MPASHTLLSDALDASGVYVGITRGHETNRLHVVAADLDDAGDRFTAAPERDRADREAGSGSGQWERAVAALARQHATHRAEADEQQEVVAATNARAVEVRAAVAAPLIEEATADGSARLTSRERMWKAQATRAAAGRLRQRAAGREATKAPRKHRSTEHAVRRRWDELPTSAIGMEPWAETVAGKRADTDSRVIETRQKAKQTRREQIRLAERHLRESSALRRPVLGSATPTTASTRATERQAAERVEAAREARAAQLSQRRPSRDHGPPGTERNFGPSL